MPNNLSWTLSQGALYEYEASVQLNDAFFEFTITKFLIVGTHGKLRVRWKAEAFEQTDYTTYQGNNFEVVSGASLQACKLWCEYELERIIKELFYAK